MQPIEDRRTTNHSEKVFSIRSIVFYWLIHWSRRWSACSWDLPDVAAPRACAIAWQCSLSPVRYVPHRVSLSDHCSLSVRALSTAFCVGGDRRRRGHRRADKRSVYRDVGGQRSGARVSPAQRSPFAVRCTVSRTRVLRGLPLRRALSKAQYNLVYVWERWRSWRGRRSDHPERRCRWLCMIGANELHVLQGRFLCRCLWQQSANQNNATQAKCAFVLKSIRWEHSFECQWYVVCADKFKRHIIGKKVFTTWVSGVNRCQKIGRSYSIFRTNHYS